MTKFWTYFKKIVLIWGFISLAFFLFAVVSLTISSVVSHKAAEKVQDDSFEKTVNDLKLKVTRKNDETNSFFVSVTKANTPLIIDYKLPTKQFDLDSIEISDATIIPVKENAYRIILYSAVHDCDQESGHYIWLLKFDGKMNFIKMINLSDMHKIEGSETFLFGNKTIDYGNEQITVPMELRISDEIRTAPMLNQRSIGMMRRYYEKEYNERMPKLSKISDAALLEQYQKAFSEFNEVLSEKVIPY